MCLRYHSFHFIWAKSQTSARHHYTLSPGRQVLWFDRVWASIWSEWSVASHRGMTCDKWVLSGVCGIGKPTLFPFDYINRQENGTRGNGWNSIVQVADSHFHLFFLQMIKRPEEVCFTQSGHIRGWLWPQCFQLTVHSTVRRENIWRHEYRCVNIKEPLTVICRSIFTFSL